MPLTLDEQVLFQRLMDEGERRSSARFTNFFADSGPLARALYPRH